MHPSQSMDSITPALVADAAEIIGTENITDDEMEAKMLALTGDAMVARRLIDWIPEAFGKVLISRLGKVTFGKTFSARDARGKWKSIPMSSEPIYAIAVSLAQQIYQVAPVHAPIKRTSRPEVPYSPASTTC